MSTIGGPIDRRGLLSLMAALSGGALLKTAPALAGDAPFKLANPRYSAMYDNKSYYFGDPQWVKWTTPRLTWPAAGDKVPELTVVIPANQPDWLDAFRKWSSDAETIGLKYDIQQASLARWLELITSHKHGDVEVHPAILRPERVDPSEWLVSRAYGLDRRNYGEWTNQQYDHYIDLQTAASQHDARVAAVNGAQEVLAQDFYIQQFGWGPSIIEAYNSGAWDGVVQSRGFGIGSFNSFHTFLRMKAKTSRNIARVGMTALLETTNLLDAGNYFRAIGRMIYDRLAFFDENLNVIPWAAKSWQQVDDRTWDIKLRPGMQFHDGKPVTIDDLKFTFDFMLKWERGIFWTANRFLQGTEIKDRDQGILRATFKQPYGQFDSYFMQLNVILPQHVFATIMQEQNVGDDPRRLRIDKPMGSGPFKFGRYRKDQELQLIAEKTHFSKPTIDELWIVVAPTIDGLLGQLEGQDIDFIESSDTVLRPSQAKQAQSADHISVVRTPDLNWLHGVPRISCLPWRDIEFRRAWHHSIDRQFLVDVPWEGAGHLPKANTFLVEGNPWNNPNLPPIPNFDLKEARSILKAAGYSWAADGRLVYPPPTDAKFRERVQRVCKPGYDWGGLQMLD